MISSSSSFLVSIYKSSLYTQQCLHFSIYSSSFNGGQSLNNAGGETFMGEALYQVKSSKSGVRQETRVPGFRNSITIVFKFSG